jgi:hypothetical protein
MENDIIELIKKSIKEESEKHRLFALNIENDEEKKEYLINSFNECQTLLLKLSSEAWKTLINTEDL